MLDPSVLDALKQEPPTRAEERELIRSSLAGDVGARDRLVAANQRLVYSIAKRLTLVAGALELEDLMAEGSIGLMVAIERFDPARGLKLSTFATHYIHGCMLRAIANTGALVRIPAIHHVGTKRLKPIPVRSLDAALGGGDDDGEATLLDRLADADEELAWETPPWLEQRLKALPRRLRWIIELRFGLDGREPAMLHEVGQIVGLSRERVRQLESRALLQLRGLPTKLSAPASERGRVSRDERG